MKYFSPKNLTERENYKLLTGSIIPRPIALILTANLDKTINIAPFSYFNIVTSNPPILSVSIQRKNGKMKDTATHILNLKQAVIHLVNEDNVVDANQTSANLLIDESELDLTKFTLTDSINSSLPSIKESLVRFETSLYQHIPITNNDETTADLILLSVDNYVIEDELLDNFRIDQNKLKPVARLAGQNYSKLGELFSLERPL